MANQNFENDSSMSKLGYNVSVACLPDVFFFKHSPLTKIPRWPLYIYKCTRSFQHVIYVFPPPTAAPEKNTRDSEQSKLRLRPQNTTIGRRSQVIGRCERAIFCISLPAPEQNLNRVALKVIRCPPSFSAPLDSCSFLRGSAMMFTGGPESEGFWISWMVD